MNLVEAQDEMRRLSQLLDDGLAYLRKCVTEHAEAEADYRHAVAKAFLEANSSTVKGREMLADSKTHDERQRAYLARGMEKAALEAVRSRRQQISALQSLLSAHKTEAEFERTGPR